MTRDAVTERVRAAKRADGLSWSALAERIGGGSTVFITAGLLGQQRLTPEQASKAAEILGLEDEARTLLCEVPYRGSLPAGPPTDPLIYRFYELLQVYGTTLKALIEEEFGDGIMSAIDFEMTLGRVDDPKGDRVKLELSGKFLPYRRF